MSWPHCDNRGGVWRSTCTHNWWMEQRVGWGEKKKKSRNKVEVCDELEKDGRNRTLEANGRTRSKREADRRALGPWRG